MSALKTVRSVFVGVFVASLLSHCEARWFGDVKCPSKWFDAQIMASIDEVVPAPPVLDDPDPELTLLRDVLQLSEEEIQTVIEDLIDYFDTRFGLNFSQSTPNAQGQRTFENAVFSPRLFRSEPEFIVTLNSWILTGSTHSLCFKAQVQSFVITFTGEQLLHGTYGGEDGILIAPPDIIEAGYFSIPVRPSNPTVIQFRSIIPSRLTLDSVALFDFELYNEDLGSGEAFGVVVYTDLGDGTVHVLLRSTIAFPGRPGLLH